MDLLTIRGLNSECENALIDLPFHDEITTWLNDHRALFLKISFLLQENTIEEMEQDRCQFMDAFQKYYLAAQIH